MSGPQFYDTAVFADGGSYFTDVNLPPSNDAAFNLDDMNLYTDFSNTEYFPAVQNEAMPPMPDLDVPFLDVEVSPTDQTAPSVSTDSDRSVEPGSKTRRRAQNRASQRAFRERKEKHLRSLKSTLQTLGEKHRVLLESYSKQSQTELRLRARDAELQAEMKAFSSSKPSERSSSQFSGSSRSSSSSTASGRVPPGGFDNFDAFSFSSGSVRRLDADVSRRNLLSVSNLPSADLQGLPEFEDLLAL